MIKIFDELEQVETTIKEVKKNYPKMAFILTKSENVYNHKGAMLDVKGNLYAIADKDGLEELLNIASEIQHTGALITLIISPVEEIDEEFVDLEGVE